MFDWVLNTPLGTQSFMNEKFCNCVNGKIMYVIDFTAKTVCVQEELK